MSQCSVGLGVELSTPCRHGGSSQSVRGFRLEPSVAADLGYRLQALGVFGGAANQTRPPLSFSSPSVLLGLFIKLHYGHWGRGGILFLMSPSCWDFEKFGSRSFPFILEAVNFQHVWPTYPPPHTHTLDHRGGNISPFEEWPGCASRYGKSLCHEWLTLSGCSNVNIEPHVEAWAPSPTHAHPPGSWITRSFFVWNSSSLYY